MSVTNNVPSITDFLAMTNVEIYELPVNNCQTSELYQGISQKIDHPVNKQILALKYFLHKFESSAEKAELFDSVIPKLTESLSELFQSTQLGVLSSLLPSLSLTLCDTIDLTCGDSSLALQSLAIGILILLVELCKLIYERSNLQRDDATLVIQSVHIVGTKILSFLETNEANYFPEELTNADVKFINKLIFILCEMAEIVSKLFKGTLLAAAWRCILTFCTGRISNSWDKFIENDTDEKIMKFLLCAVKKSCFCIKYDLQEISESSDKNTLKFRNKTIVFATSILQRLAATYSHHRFRGHDHVLTTQLILMRKTRTQPNEFLQQSLAVGLQKAVLLICKSHQFVEAFHRASCDEFSSELLHIGMEISKKLINDDDSEFLHFVMKSEDQNMACKLLDCLAIDASVAFTKSQTYMEAIDILSTLLIRTSKTVNPKIASNVLIMNLLQCDNNLDYILIDLWIAWTRCLSEAERFNLMLFLSVIIENMFTTKPIHLRTKIPIRNLYDSLTESQKLKFRLSKPINGNIKLWNTLGVRRITDTNGTVEILKLHDKIDALYREFSAERKHSTLIKLIEHLRLMETMSQTNNPVPDYLIELWNLNWNHQPHKFSSLIVSLIRISIANERKLNDSERCLILRKLTSIAGSSNIPIFLKMEILNYLRHVAVKYFTVEHQQDILKSIRQLFKKNFVDSNPIVKRKAFITYALVINEAQHDDIALDQITDDVLLKTELFNFIRINKTVHKSRDEQMQFAEKLKNSSKRNTLQLATTDDDKGVMHGLEIRMKGIVERMQTDAKELADLNRKHRCTEEIFQNIASIRQELALLK